MKGIYIILNTTAVILLSTSFVQKLTADNMPTELNDSIQIITEDSIKTKELKEVVVEANRQFIDDERTTFIPTTNEKKISAGGIALLQNMAIPTVVVAPIDNSVRTIDGEAVATYIDFLPATQNELNSLRTMDVARVEVYDYSSDPRFGGARHVVNIILKKYQYGGYTSIMGNQTFVANHGNYGIAAKFAYKKMTYDLSVNYDYSKNSHIGEYAITDYVFPEDVVRLIESTEDGLSQNRVISAIFRAVYQSERAVMSNTIGFQGMKTPNCHQVDKTNFSSAMYLSGQTSTSTENRNFRPSWSGAYQFFLPKNFSLVFNPTISFGAISQRYDYISANALIENDVDETVWNFSISTALQKRINNHTISISLSGGGQNNKLEYFGTTPSDVETKYYYSGGRLAANLNFGKAWVQGNVGLYYNCTKINEKDKSEIVPKYFIAAGYNFNERNNISISSQMSYWSVPLSQQGDNYQSLNQIDVIQGNPDLETFLYNSLSVKYQWLATNRFSMALYGGFYRFTNPVSSVYNPSYVGDMPIMVKQYANGGFLNNWNYGGAAVFRSLNGALTFRVGLSGETISSHCVGKDYSDNLISFNGLAQYIKNGFWTQLSYNSKSKSISTSSQTETPPFYRLSIGWGNGNFNVSASVLNLFNSSWRGIRNYISAGCYNNISEAYTNNYHRALEIAISYSFSYGKNVIRTDAPKSNSSVSSAILE